MNPCQADDQLAASFTLASLEVREEGKCKYDGIFEYLMCVDDFPENLCLKLCSIREDRIAHAGER